jgi:hypothetical protein
MFRKRKKQGRLAQSAESVVVEAVDDLVAGPAEPAKCPTSPFDSLPYIDNDTLDEFLSDQDIVEMLPVNPSDFRREIQRLIVSAYLHEASRQAKQVEIA